MQKKDTKCTQDTDTQPNTTEPYDKPKKNLESGSVCKFDAFNLRPLWMRDMDQRCT